MKRDLRLTQTGGAIRMVDEESGGAYWQTCNDSSKDKEPVMGINEPLVMDPRHFQSGTTLAVLEPESPVARDDAAIHALEGNGGGKAPSEWVRVRRHGQWLIVEWEHKGEMVELGRELLDSNFSSEWNLTVRKEDKAKEPA